MEIKRCPFCGHEAKVVTASGKKLKYPYEEYYVECTNILCQARTRSFIRSMSAGIWNTEIDAIVAWNHREETE